MPAGDVVLLVIDNALCRIAARRLAARFPGLTIIVEQRVPSFKLIRGRVRRLGLVRTAGQIAFILYSRLIIRRAGERIAEIIAAAGLEARWPDGVERVEVVSVNAPDTIARLQMLRPKVVLVVGTRIISRKVLSAIEAPFINYHDGITPKYRGIHGGYWASASNDLVNFGATVHLVDPGIDTGAVLYQVRLRPLGKDNYATFSYLQVAAALPLLVRAAEDAIAGTVAPQTVDLPSHLWSHPTIWSYLPTGICRRGGGRAGQSFSEAC
jgi:phosphoribosylglycinamide formyltransferase-1